MKWNAGKLWKNYYLIDTEIAKTSPLNKIYYYQGTICIEKILYKEATV